MLYFYEYDGSIVQLFINLLVKVIFKMFKNNNYYYSLRYYDILIRHTCINLFTI